MGYSPGIYFTSGFRNQLLNLVASSTFKIISCVNTLIQIMVGSFLFIKSMIDEKMFWICELRFCDLRISILRKNGVLFHRFVFHHALILLFIFVIILILIYNLIFCLFRTFLFIYSRIWKFMFRSFTTLFRIVTPFYKCVLCADKELKIEWNFPDSKNFPTAKQI